MLFQLNMQYKERIQKIAFILLFVWPIFFIPFGVDVGDSCYYLANYRHFFSGSVHHAVGTVLSSLLGSILYHINPFPMFITFRVLDYLINCVVWYCIYRMLKDSVSDLWLIPGIFVGAVLIRTYPMILSYNSFSALFFVLALFAMQQGLLKKQVKKIMLSGFLVGLNVMVRIPNALQGIMIILPLLYAAVDRAFTSKTAWRYSLYFLLASVSGLLLGVGITVVFSGWTLFVEGIKKLFLFGQGGSYSLQAVWNNINSEIIEIYEYLSPLKKYVFIAFTLPFIYTACRTFIRQNWMLHCVRILIAGITLWLAYRLGIGFNPQKYIYFLGSVSFILSVLTILASAKLNKKLFLQAAMVLIVLVIWPLGTNNGMAHYSLIGAFLSGALIAYFNVFQGRTWNNSLQTSFVSSASTIGAALLLLIFFTGISTYQYFDP